jgi:hypothetical protein
MNMEETPGLTMETRRTKLISLEAAQSPYAAAQ